MGNGNNYHLTDDYIDRSKSNETDDERWAAVDKVKNKEKDERPQGKS